MKKAKKEKKKKLESLPKIRKRLFKIWSEKCRERANHKCEYCGRGKGDLNKNDKPLVKVDAHHLQSRKISGNPLKWDLRNSVCVCPLHHKFSCNESFHKSPIITIAWLIKNHPERFNYVLEHYNDTVDLDNRLVLQEVERCLNANEPLNIERLKEIEQNSPRKSPEVKYESNLFEEEKKSSSSSN